MKVGFRLKLIILLILVPAFSASCVAGENGNNDNESARIDDSAGDDATDDNFTDDDTGDDADDAADDADDEDDTGDDDTTPDDDADDTGDDDTTPDDDVDDTGDDTTDDDVDDTGDDDTDDDADDAADDVDDEDDTDDDDTGDDDTGDDDTGDDDTGDDDTGDDDTGAPACETYGLPQAVGTLGTADLTETSGLAVSRHNPGVLWAHNDSGDGPFLYAMTLDGSYLGRLKLDGATATDWEDMAAGPCGAEDCLYVGDIGDNGASRPQVRLYRVVEPEVDPAVPFGEMTTSVWEVFPFTYPGGARNAESLAVHPDGRVYVFSKYPSGISEMYVFPALTPDEPVELIYLDDLDTGGIAATTAADIHPGGRRLLLRTYLTALEWRLPVGGDFDDLAAVGQKQLVPAALEAQGEALAYVPEDGNYLHASEGQGATIYRVPCSGLK